MRTGRVYTDVGIQASTVTASATVRCMLAVCLGNHFPSDISSNRSQDADPNSQQALLRPQQGGGAPCLILLTSVLSVPYGLDVCPPSQIHLLNP